MDKKPSDQDASEAATDAHSPDPETRKEAMATLRERRGKNSGSGDEDKSK